MAGTSEHGHETLGSIKWGKFLDYWRSISFSRTVDHVFILGVADKTTTLGIIQIHSTSRILTDKEK